MRKVPDLVHDSTMLLLKERFRERRTWQARKFDDIMQILLLEKRRSQGRMVSILGLDRVLSANIHSFVRSFLSVVLVIISKKS